MSPDRADREARHVARMIEMDLARERAAAAAALARIRSRARLVDYHRTHAREAGEVAPGVVLLVFGCGAVAAVTWFVASVLGALASVIPS